MTCRTGNYNDDAPDDLCLVTTYFNPAGYTKKRQRYLDFAARCEVSNLTLFTIECAFGNRAFEIPEAETVLRVRARDAMWQKERLLNLATAHIPAKFTKLVSIDFDVIFENPQWAILTSQQLDIVPLVQPFETVVWLPRDVVSDDGSGRVLSGFAERHATDPSLQVTGDFLRHGVPGFARAARRELLEAHGLYDECVVGGGDHLVAHAACGDWSSPCFEWSVGVGSEHHRHFVRWAEPFHRDVRGRFGYVPGRLLHVWHGSWRSRMYSSRHRFLMDFDFDPDRDLVISSDGCWEWSSPKPGLHEAVASYFSLRREDGDEE